MLDLSASIWMNFPNGHNYRTFDEFYFDLSSGGFRDSQGVYESEMSELYKRFEEWGPKVEYPILFNFGMAILIYEDENGNNKGNWISQMLSDCCMSSFSNSTKMLTNEPDIICSKCHRSSGLNNVLDMTVYSSMSNSEMLEYAIANSVNDHFNPLEAIVVTREIKCFLLDLNEDLITAGKSETPVKKCFEVIERYSGLLGDIGRREKLAV